MSARVVVVGSGSAGRRHAAAIRRRLPDAEIHVVRRPESSGPTEAFAEIGATFVPSTDAALRSEPTIAVVAGPSTHHRADAVALLHAGATVLIEKPLAATLHDGRAIAAAAGAQPVVVGYHLRCSETVVALRSLLHRGTVGELTGFDLRVGQHLEHWRPGTDARAGVSARHELGGGVLLELSHELDGVLDLLGPVRTLRASTRTDGAPTDGVVDTVAALDVVLDGGVTGSVHLDMVSEPAFREWTVTGDAGSLHADLLAGTIELRTDTAARVVHRSDPGERDRAEERLIDNLVAVAAGSEHPVCTLADGLAVLELVEAARRSAATGDVVDVDGRLADRTRPTEAAT